MSALTWTLLIAVILAIVITVYVFISAARLFGTEEEGAAFAMNGYHHRALGDRRQNPDRRVTGKTVSFPLTDRFGTHVTHDRRSSMRDRRQLPDRRLQTA